MRTLSLSVLQVSSNETAVNARIDRDLAAANELERCFTISFTLATSSAFTFALCALQARHPNPQRDE